MVQKNKPYYRVIGENRGDVALFQSESIQETIDWLNELLLTVHDFSLMGELNDMQQWAGVSVFEKDEKNRFNSKYEIPLYFINLVLHKYNLSILS